MIVNAKYIIIGAGLSGLTTAFALHTSGITDFIIIESRDRMGGRILTQDGVDLGATWYQEHHTHVIDLLDKLGIDSFPQYNRGRSALVYSTMAPPHYFENDANAPRASRVAGGTLAVIEGLCSRFLESVHLNTTVNSISYEPNQITVTTDKNTYTANRVISTLPPRLAKNIAYTPELPINLTQQMEDTHTWMSNAIKVGLTFKTPFWREKGLSGMIIGQAASVTELYDHTSADGKTHALMGFINETLRLLTPKDRKTKILKYLEDHLGNEVYDYLSYQEKDWSQDRNTAREHIKSLYMSPQYGHRIFDNGYMNDRLLFSGAETSAVHGGYMDGAIYSGLLAAHKIING